MFSFKSIVLIAMASVIGVECGEVALPAVAAPLTVPAHVGYAHGVPQNVLPYASQISFVNRGFAAPLAAPVAPLAAPVVAPYAAPIAARVAAPFAAAPYFAGPAPVSPYALPGPAFGPAPYAAPAAFGAPAPYAAPYPYGAPVAAPVAGPLLRTPFAVAPAFVR